MLFALFVLQHGNGLRYGEVAAIDAHEPAAQVGRHHYLVKYGARFLDRADNVAAGELIALLRRGHKAPLFAPVERGDVGAAAYGGAGKLAYLRQGALDTVVDVFQHTRSELDRHRHTGGFDHGARSETRGLLIDLYRGAVAGHVKYLAYKSVGTYAHDVGNVRIAQPLRNYKRA